MVIEPVDGRMKRQAMIERDNRAKVKAYFVANPGATISECQRALNLSWSTVSRHVKAINKKEEGQYD